MLVTKFEFKHRRARRNAFLHFLANIKIILYSGVENAFMQVKSFCLIYYTIHQTQFWIAKKCMNNFLGGKILTGRKVQKPVGGFKSSKGTKFENYKIAGQDRNVSEKKGSKCEVGLYTGLGSAYNSISAFFLFWKPLHRRRHFPLFSGLQTKLPRATGNSHLMKKKSQFHMWVIHYPTNSARNHKMKQDMARQMDEIRLSACNLTPPSRTRPSIWDFRELYYSAVEFKFNGKYSSMMPAIKSITSTSGILRAGGYIIWNIAFRGLATQ